MNSGMLFRGEAFTPFEDFTASPLPGSVNAYKAYRQLAIQFIEARNRRIDRYVASSDR